MVQESDNDGQLQRFFFSRNFVKTEIWAVDACNLDSALEKYKGFKEGIKLLEINNAVIPHIIGVLNGRNLRFDPDIELTLVQLCECSAKEKKLKSLPTAETDDCLMLEGVALAGVLALRAIDEEDPVKRELMLNEIVELLLLAPMTVSP